HSADHIWPPLSEFKSTHGRAANAADVNDGAAIFVLGDKEKPSGNPINIALPQYAFHVDSETGKKTPCIVIQAEEIEGRRLIGALLLPKRGALAGFFNEFELLGSKNPSLSEPNKSLERTRPRCG